MKRNLLQLFLASILLFCAYAQTPTPSPSPSSSPQPAKTGQAAQGDLKSVLAQMDEAANSFKSAQADVELTQYTEIVKDTSKQSGQAFFRLRGKNMDVALFLVAEGDPTRKDKKDQKADRPPKPLQPKQVVVNGDSFSFFDPNTGQCTARKIGDYRADVQTMMNLGFGGRGEALLKEFDVKLAAWETVDNVQTARLELVPKSDDLKRFFTRLTLWIDPKRDVPIKQQRFESSGDYQLTHYTNIRLPGKISDNLFRLKPCGNE
jgi:outer membrane lipoprotein-sorting protein